MTTSELYHLSVRSPVDLICAVPYLLGFHPSDSVVVVGMRDRRVVFAARGDLTVAGAGAEQTARHIAEVVARQPTDAAVIIGYGAAERVTPVIDALVAAMHVGGPRLLDAIRVTDGRYWSYFCSEPDCCPSEGVGFDLTTSRIAAAATFAGQVALPDRATLVRSVEPVDGPAREALRRATEDAERRHAALLAEAESSGARRRTALRRAGRAAVAEAFKRARGANTITDDEVAWLGLLLRDDAVRDHAWRRTGADERHVRLWTDVLRRVDPEHAAAPACLLSYAAWRCGEGALAVVALDRALAVEPDNTLAMLMDDVLRRGIQPVDELTAATPGTPGPG